MNEPKHTPGPWIVDKYCANQVRQPMLSKRRRIVCPPDADGIKDARLIAKAPDMLELLRDAFDRFTDNDMMPPNHALKTWLEKAIIIFQKLEG